MKGKNLIIALTVAIIAVVVFFVLRMAASPACVRISQEGKKNIEAVERETEGALFAIAENADNGSELLKARDAYTKFIEKYPASDKMPKAQEALESLNIRILLSPLSTPDSVVYEVEKGDSLVKIAKKFNTTPELLARANNIKDNKILIGKRLKVSKAKFSIAVDKSQNILTLKSNQEILKTYKVATGKKSCTPVGTFKIINKLIDPPWYPPSGKVVPPGDPKNVLGSRWLGLSKQGYGIHGTIEPETIGQSVTEGCVRMKNSDVEELYSIVPVGTEVVIVD